MTDLQLDIHDPYIDCAERWPDWRVHTTNLHGIGEVIDYDRKVILTDPAYTNPAVAVAHSVAHLDLEHRPESGRFTEDQCRDADGVAHLRMNSTGLVASLAA